MKRDKLIVLAVTACLVLSGVLYLRHRGSGKADVAAFSGDSANGVHAGVTRGKQGGKPPAPHGKAVSGGSSLPRVARGQVGSYQSARIKDRFGYGKLLVERERIPAGSTNRVVRERLIDTGGKYPLKLVVDTFETASGGRHLIHQVAMVGDHIVVTVPSGRDALVYSAVKANGFSVLRKMHAPHSFLIAARPATLDTVNLLTNAMLRAGAQIAEPDFVVSLAETTPDDPQYNKLWGMNKIDMPKVWSMATGNGKEVVAVFDTGTDLTHEDLVNRIWHNPKEIPDNGIDDDNNGYVDDIYGWDFYSDDNDPSDVYGHGSHVAGTIAAEGNNAKGVAGVGWNLRLMSCKFFGRNVYGQLEGFASDAMDGIYYVITQHNAGVPVHVTSHSWGGSGYSASLEEAMDIAGGQGIMHVVAAGNDGNLNNDTDPQYPASYALSNIIAVANTTSSDVLNSSSHYGATSVDLAAPGTSIYSVGWGGGYKYMSGTSMATPHVSGVAALMFAYMPQLTWQQVRQAIFDGVDPLASLAGKCVTGGRLNAFGAFSQVGPFIEHTPLDNTYSGADHIVDATIRPTLPLVDTNATFVLWNTTGDSNTFATSVLARVTNDQFRAVIPEQPLGTSVYYMLKVTSIAGRVRTLPEDAPATLYSFEVTEPVDLLIYGTPGNYGPCVPGYGNQTAPYGSTVNAVADLNTVPTNGTRYHCSGYYGGGDAPATGSSNAVSFVITRTSAIMWIWDTQYALTQTSSVAGIVTATNWWNAGSSATTVVAPEATSLNATNYMFTWWEVDGARWPDATNAAQNPATGISMGGARQAEAIYIPEARDSDSDNLPDWWELRYFGGLMALPGSDSDGDGFINSLEYADRSNPRDPASIPSGPKISIEPLPDPMTNISPWQVSAVVSDRVGVASVTLYWQRGSQPWSNSPMHPGANNTYSGEIPSPHALGDTYHYYLMATDSASNISTGMQYSFTVKYPLISATPNPIAVTLAHPGNVASGLLLDNNGNARLDWHLRTNWLDRIEGGTNGWTHSGTLDLWHVSAANAFSGSYSWYCGRDEEASYDNAMDARLVTPEVTLGTAPVLTFKQWFQSEYDGRAGYEDYFWDGGVVDISTDGGTTFSRIVPVGGYPYKITPNPDSPFPSDMPCLAGTGGWESVQFDLAAYAGKSVRVRFRFGSDHYTVARGWFIDDVRLDWQGSWLKMDATSGSISTVGQYVGLTLDAVDLAEGEHANSLTLVSNDPTTPLLNIPATLHILSDTMDSGIGLDSGDPTRLVIRWPSDAFHAYTLYSNTNLNFNTWQIVPGYQGVPGIDGTMSYTVSVHNASSIYYRVDEEE